MAKQVLHTFSVKQADGYSSFPIDMLRSDHCYPVTENDSATITYSFTRRRGTVGPITLCRYAHREWAPNEARWKSFGWEVTARGCAIPFGGR